MDALSGLLASQKVAGEGSGGTTSQAEQVIVAHELRYLIHLFVIAISVSRFDLFRCWSGYPLPHLILYLLSSYNISYFT